MKAKKETWVKIKEFFFIYFAVSKLIYWFNTIITINLEGLEGAWQAVFNRLMGQDLLIIVCIFVFTFLDRLIDLKASKYSKVLEYVIFHTLGYIAFAGIMLIYFWALGLVFGTEGFSLGDYIQFMIYGTIGYAFFAVVLDIQFRHKEKVKEKERLEYVEALNANDKMAALQILLDSGVLTQEEFEEKKIIILD